MPVVVYAGSICSCVKEGGTEKDKIGIYNILTSFRVESIAFRADGATAS